ncbi:MAG: CHAD domain-containing protein [Pseudomonadota bacterium]
MLEVETKYLLAPGRNWKTTNRQLKRTLRKAGFALSRAERYVINDSYYDTPCRSLQKQGWTLRERCTLLRRKAKRSTPPEHRVETTLKTISAAGPRFVREEISQASLLPKAHLPPNGPVGTRLQQLVPPGVRIGIVTQLQNHRKVYTLTHKNFPDQSIQWSVDRVTSASGLHFVEMEFEALDANQGLLNAVSRHVAGNKHLYAARMSKHRRCSEAAVPLTRTHTQSISSPPPETWSALARISLTAVHDDLERCADFAWEGMHPEGVHQMRIATRRLRALLKLFAALLPTDAARQLQRSSRQLTTALGKVRDLDVHLHQLQQHNRSIPARYILRIQRLRQRQHTHLRQHLDTHFATLQHSLSELITGIPERDDSLATGLRQQFQPFLTHLLKRGRRKDLLNPRQLHQFRLMLKTVVYQLVILAPYHPLLASMHKRATRLQRNLGHLQDGQMAMRLIQDNKLNTDGQQLDKLQRVLSETKLKSRRFHSEWSKFCVHAETWQQLDNPVDYTET